MSEKPLFVPLDPDRKLRLRVDAARHDRSMSEHVRAWIDELPPVEEIPAQVAG